VVFEAFGPERIMIGSDWPVCLLAGSYSRVMDVVLDYISGLQAHEQLMIVGGTAQKVYLQSQHS
ncbi:MAG: amidohydrolase family protein, partial [Paludibacter sp.]|nr:amidohydrolase family protein [Paludibacter sp.]